jgi:hypothetical protein
VNHAACVPADDVHFLMIVTRNPGLFRRAKLPALLPEALLAAGSEGAE